MTPLLSEQHKPQPFLARYASERTASAEIDGHYCEAQSMWVMSRGGNDVPLIELNSQLVELVTKTHAQQEADDQEQFSAGVELETKTATKVEHDNADISVCQEMATKTDAQLESDDTSSGMSGMFL